MMFIELPEGTYVSVEAIVAVTIRPLSEYDDSPNGAIIFLASGHDVQTEETVERVLAQIGECIAAAQEAEDGE